MMKKRIGLLAAFGTLWALAASAGGAGVAPNVFAPGQKILSAQVNENFANLYARTPRILSGPGSTGTITVPPGMSTMVLEGTGGGGGAGGGTCGSSASVQPGGPGGSSVYLRAFVPVQPGEKYDYVIGTGGAGAAAAPAASCTTGQPGFAGTSTTVAKSGSLIFDSGYGMGGQGAYNSSCASSAMSAGSPGSTSPPTAGFYVFASMPPQGVGVAGSGGKGIPGCDNIPGDGLNGQDGWLSVSFF